MNERMLNAISSCIFCIESCRPIITDANTCAKHPLSLKKPSSSQLKLIGILAQGVILKFLGIFSHLIPLLAHDN
jgi:hypothetical protein